jgi:predicted DsbA family dithiol-disulfide isomerase
MPPAIDRLEIDVVSDVVCPWCYIGKRRLETALAALRASDPALEPIVRWHPFQLNPDFPREGVDRRSYVERKFGGPLRAAEVYARITAAASSAGLAFHLERIVRQPNTLDAHRLIAWAQAQRDANVLVEALFAAYFVEGRAIGDRDVLAAVAGEAGFDAQAAQAMLDGNEFEREVAAADARAREIGVGGVPFFVFAGRVGLSGAHEPATMLQAIAQARAPRTGRKDERG